MSRTAFDGIGADAAAIYQKAQLGDLVLHYPDGRYAWTQAELAPFVSKGIELIAITVTGDPACAIADYEAGDNFSVRGYVRARLARGTWPTIYCNRDTRPKVAALCQGLSYDLILADPTGQPHAVDGAVGVQWFWGLSYDMTSITDPDWYTRGHYGARST